MNTSRILRLHAWFYQTSTSEMFGLAQKVPPWEATRFYPCAHYSLAKAFSHDITMNYRENYGMHARLGILLNHESPLLGKEFVSRKITLGLGNMDAQRDWGFAGDYVEGMWRMLQQDVADGWVLATGATATDHKSGKLVMKLNPSSCSPAEVASLIGDASKTRTALGGDTTG